MRKCDNTGTFVLVFTSNLPITVLLEQFVYQLFQITTHCHLVVALHLIDRIGRWNGLGTCQMPCVEPACSLHTVTRSTARSPSEGHLWGGRLGFMEETTELILNLPPPVSTQRLLCVCSIKWLLLQNHFHGEEKKFTVSFKGNFNQSYEFQ